MMLYFPPESTGIAAFYRVLRRPTVLLILMLVGTGSLSYNAEVHKANEDITLTPYKATYKARIKGFIFPLGGKAVRELTIRPDGAFKLTSEATNSMIKISESSDFRLLEGQLKPDHYTYERTGVGKNRNALLTFDWEKLRVLNDVEDIPWQMDITQQTLDKLIYQLQLRVDLLHANSNNESVSEFHYVVADGGRLKDYYFQSLGMEPVQTPLGELQALKLERVKARKNRETVIWLDPRQEYLLIKMVQEEKKGRRLELNLLEVSFNHPLEATTGTMSGD